MGSESEAKQSQDEAKESEGEETREEAVGEGGRLTYH